MMMMRGCQRDVLGLTSSWEAWWKLWAGFDVLGFSPTPAVFNTGPLLSGLRSHSVPTTGPLDL